MNVSTPAIIAACKMKNRFFIPAHASGLFTASGLYTEEAVSYYSARLRGGAALLFLGETLVEADGETWGIPVSSNKNIASQMRLSRIARKEDCRLFEQLSSQGGQVWWAPGVIAKGPSPIPHPISGVRPAAMSKSDIARIRKAFVAAARRGMQSGLDGCEIKSDQGKLVAQFLSRRYNRRSDEYGKTSLDRRRFLRQILMDIREAKSQYTLGIRIALGSEYANDDEFPDLAHDEATEIILDLAENNLLDFVSISAGTNSWPKGYRLGHCDHGVEVRWRDAVVFQLRKSIGIPVLYAGQFANVRDANDLLANGVCDFVGFARSHIADPQFSEKIIYGRQADIRPCIRCTQGCVGSTWEGRPIRCIVNPDAGRERLKNLYTSRRSRNQSMLVVGAGPAGLECALSAANSGWRVVLTDRSRTIGGRLRIASAMQSDVDWKSLISYYDGQLARHRHVDCRLGIEVDIFASEWSGHDQVVYAGGRAFHLPEEFKRTAKRVPAYSVASALKAIRTVHGKSILLVDEDPNEGLLALAVKYASLGAHVRVITTQEFVGKGLDQVSLARYIQQLRELNVPTDAFTELTRLLSTGAELRCLCSGQSRRIEAEAVVLGIPPLSLDISEKLVDSSQIHLIGDAKFPRGVQYALADARDLVVRLTIRKDGRK